MSSSQENDFPELLDNLSNDSSHNEEEENHFFHDSILNPILNDSIFSRMVEDDAMNSKTTNMIRPNILKTSKFMSMEKSGSQKFQTNDLNRSQTKYLQENYPYSTISQQPTYICSNKYLSQVPRLNFLPLKSSNSNFIIQNQPNFYTGNPTNRLMNPIANISTHWQNNKIQSSKELYNKKHQHQMVGMEYNSHFSSPFPYSYSNTKNLNLNNFNMNNQFFNTNNFTNPRPFNQVGNMMSSQVNINNRSFNELNFEMENQGKLINPPINNEMLDKRRKRATVTFNTTEKNLENNFQIDEIRKQKSCLRSNTKEISKEIKNIEYKEELPENYNAEDPSIKNFLNPTNYIYNIDSKNIYSSYNDTNYNKDPIQNQIQIRNPNEFSKQEGVTSNEFIDIANNQASLIASNKNPSKTSKCDEYLIDNFDRLDIDPDMNTNNREASLEELEYLVNNLNVDLGTYICTIKGCKEVQNLINSESIKSSFFILKHIKNKLIKVMNDHNANYLFQKIIQPIVSNPRNRLWIIRHIFQGIPYLATDVSGKHSLQALLHPTDDLDEISLLIDSLVTNYQMMFYNYNSAQCVQRILVCIDETLRPSLNNMIIQDIVNLVRDQNGVCIVKIFYIG